MHRGMEARTRTGTRLDCVCEGEGEWGNTSDESDYPIFPIHVHTGPFFYLSRCYRGHDHCVYVHVNDKKDA